MPLGPLAQSASVELAGGPAALEHYRQGAHVGEGGIKSHLSDQFERHTTQTRARPSSPKPPAPLRYFVRLVRATWADVFKAVRLWEAAAFSYAPGIKMMPIFSLQRRGLQEARHSPTPSLSCKSGRMGMLSQQIFAGAFSLRAC